MPEFRKGREAVNIAAEKKSGGFMPFVPEVRWREDGEKKYILVLTAEDEVTAADVHEFIKVGVKQKANGETYPDFQAFISRRDPAVGEGHDDLQDRLGNVPKTRVLGVVVELEPVFETVRGRQRPKGFTVKTSSYNRRTDDGEEEVTLPLIGVVMQSKHLMWGPLLGLDEAQGPFSELPIEVTRRFTDTNTRYEFVPFMDAPVDLTPLIENVEGVSYLRDDMDEVKTAIDAASDDKEAAMAVADILLTHRLTELCDQERYDTLVSPIQHLEQRFGGGGKKSSTKSRSGRPARPSLRPEAEAQEAPPVQDTPSKDEKFAKLRASIESKQG